MEKQLMPQLRFPINKKESYSFVKFGSVIKDSGYGPRFNGNDYDVNGNVKTIRGTDISLDGEIKYNQVPIANLDETFVKNHILNDGDLVMITTADCGLTGVFRQQGIDFIPSAYAVKISLKETASPIYFKYFFQTSIAKNQINRFVRKATVANLPGSDIPKLNVNIPSLPEQQKIASFLTDVDDKITKLTKKKILLEQYKKGIMQKIFNQELRFKDENGYKFPKWEEKKLGSICNYKNGGSFEQYVSNEGVYNLISLNSLDINGKLKPSHKKVTINDNSLDKGDLVMVLSDVAHGYFLGLTDIVPDNTFVLNQRMGALKPKININSYFLKTYINFNQKYFKLMGQGSSQQNLSKGDILKFTVKTPIIEEQIKIANFLSDIDIKIEVLNTKIENSKAFKKGLLQQMFV